VFADALMMPITHSLPAMIDRIRALLTVIEEGSVNRAAVRLRHTTSAQSPDTGA
jgi:hypothetical protein